MNDGGNPNPINPTPEGVVNNAANPLANLEGVVAAAQEEAAAQTPKARFEAQFGSGPAAPPVAEPAPDLMGQALGGLGTTSPAVDASTSQPEQTQPTADILTQPAPETPQQQEEAPLDPNQKFIDTVAAAYEELKASQGNTTG